MFSDTQYISDLYSFQEAINYIVCLENKEFGIRDLQFSLGTGYIKCERIISELLNYGAICNYEKIYKVIINKKEAEEIIDDPKQYSIKYKIRISRRTNEFLKSKIEQEESVEKSKIRKRLLDQERLKALERDVRDELIKEGLIFSIRMHKDKSREPIPQEVMDKIWNRDGGACVKCGSRENLEFDHIIPVSKGGATSYRNLQLLCRTCNSKKSNKIG